MLPLLGSDGMSFEGNNDSMEVDVVQYHGHLWLGLCLAQVDCSKMQKQHCQPEAVQMS